MSHRGQAAADREPAVHPALDAASVTYEACRVERLAGTRERAETGAGAAHTATGPLEHAEQREENACRRDLSADARDSAAEHRDVDASRLERQPDLPRSTSKTARAYAPAWRARAADDRARAASDRKQAAADRAAAAQDREQATADLIRAQFDQLTGAFGRELGAMALEREINRARHATGRLVLAFVDVDGLKEVNDRAGHAAGDALLQDVVRAIQTHLRSYDPIVRVGGDEFICALGDTLPADARRRFRDIRATVKLIQPSASISVGFAALRPEDTLEQLTERGDVALYEAKHARPTRSA